MQNYVVSRDFDSPTRLNIFILNFSFVGSFFFFFRFNSYDLLKSVFFVNKWCAPIQDNCVIRNIFSWNSAALNTKLTFLNVLGFNGQVT